MAINLMPIYQREIIWFLRGNNSFTADSQITIIEFFEFRFEIKKTQTKTEVLICVIVF